MKVQLILLGSAMMLCGCSRHGSDESSIGANRTATGKIQHFPDVTGWPIYDGSTKQVGLVATRRDPTGVVVTVDTRGLPAGVHGVHIHQYPKCDPPGFASAGGHWNWTNKKHGHANPEGYHAGDLGNLKLGADGSGHGTFVIPWKDWDPKLASGLSIVIHAKADDERTDPSGDSGERIACGLMYLRADQH